MIDIIFLGTGDAFNTDGRGNQSLFVMTESLRFLVDAGPTCLFRMIELGYNPGELDFIFITHFHGDHTAGLPFIILYLKKRLKTARFPQIIGPTGIIECCDSLFEASYRGINLGKDLDFRVLQPKYQQNITITGDLLIDVYPINHLPESIGYRFILEHKIIAVSGDTGLDDNLLQLIDNADIAIIECSQLKPVLPTHLSLEELAQNLPRMNAGKIIPVHTTEKILNKIGEWGDEKILIVDDKKKISI